MKFKKFLEVTSYALIGGIVLWVGGEWYHMIGAQLLAGYAHLLGFREGLERAP